MVPKPNQNHVKWGSCFGTLPGGEGGGGYPKKTLQKYGFGNILRYLKATDFYTYEYTYTYACTYTYSYTYAYKYT